MEEKQGDSAARPFQLRPSILSGSGFGSSFGSFGSSGDKSSKEFTLRPSALTSAADQIDTTAKTKETRKRLHEDKADDDNDDSHEEEATKKVKTSPENTETEEPIKLTEDLQKPAGIGTFGFGDEEKCKTNGKGGEDTDSTTTNTEPNKNFFVFGNNSTAGAVGFNTLKGEEDEDTALDKSNSSSNGVVDDDENPVTEADKEKLRENADEYQLKTGHKTHLSQVEQITGEEGERNILQVFCKLHLFDKARSNWVEKGRGTLKLNDRCHTEGVFQSRLVFRTQGTNLVMLNVMLWPEMCCERVKEKSIRITSIDPDTNEAKIFLITTSVKDSLQTYVAIDRRIEALKRNKQTQDEEKDDDGRLCGDDSTSDSSRPSRQADDEDSSTECERISSREDSMCGATDDSDRHTSPSPET
jgi:Ran-binding protein 3